jgi:hypothetical protein
MITATTTLRRTSADLIEIHKHYRFTTAMSKVTRTSHPYNYISTTSTLLQQSLDDEFDHHTFSIAS